MNHHLGTKPCTHEPLGVGDSSTNLNEDMSRSLVIGCAHDCQVTLLTPPMPPVPAVLDGFFDWHPYPTFFVILFWQRHALFLFGSSKGAALCISGPFLECLEREQRWHPSGWTEKHLVIWLGQWLWRTDWWRFETHWPIGPCHCLLRICHTFLSGVFIFSGIILSNGVIHLSAGICHPARHPQKMLAGTCAWSPAVHQRLESGRAAWHS